ncbi:DUF5107 domain-containing protein [Lachnoclostridium sp. An118]|uniref:DUF5107 domain-containing protein n=1 Tax=Lachnoclostridium sp. An118 TaxID=1965547 RepID=UPI000B369F22|nr:DUF5107 domain-containing protein [Lachnoclostridium sp. An118]OUQ45936.1 DUF5107 domain-containing protein [Lachnoclostridium sp. An118]
MRPELRFETKKMRVAGLGEESCLPDLLGEKILQNELVFRLDEEDEIYEGYGRRRNAYPYRQYNCYTRELKEQEVQTAVLENDSLRAVFLPQYGGRLWELWDKEKGRSLLYTNDVLRFSNLAVRNAWFSGGVEWNIGVIGHTPLTTEPLYVARTALESGEPVLRMYEYERIRKVAYQMDFWLGEKDRFLNCRMRIVNESSQVIPMYWWSNMAVPEYEGGRVVVPAGQAFTYADGAVFKVDIPVVQGVDVTDYQKIPRSVDYFFDIPQESPKYVANVDRDGLGLLQMSTKRLRSRKLFSWGSQGGSDRWQEFLTDRAGRYIEIQAGLGKTQYGCLPMAPHTAWEWLERYGSVSLGRERMAMSHAERSASLTADIQRAGEPERMERILAETKSMAKGPASLVWAGSGYGAMRSQGKWTAHLAFQVPEGPLRSWQRFFETGELQEQDVADRPDAFLIDGDNIGFLESTLEGCNRENWYAFYQAGVWLTQDGQAERARCMLERSLQLAENPWARHALACVSLMAGQQARAGEEILQGMRLARRLPRWEDRLSYMKEGFRMLHMMGASEEIRALYRELEEGLRENSRLKFIYISALHQLGEDREAARLLEEKGGLLLEDIREGEDSIGRLWLSLHRDEAGREKKLPHQYDFSAS